MTVKTGNWKQDLVLRGKCWQVTVGSFSTPIQGGGAGTVLDNEQPELRIAIPSGTTIIPLRIQVACQMPLLAADSDESEILVAVDRTQTITDGTGTAETAINMRTDLTTTSACAVKSAFTGDMTTAIMSMELAHAVKVGEFAGVAANDMWNDLSLTYEPDAAPAIVGPAVLLVYWGGTVATTGFASASWAEFTSTDITT